MKIQAEDLDPINNLLEEGWYDAEIISAEDTTSKAGNDMIKLTVKVYPEEGGSRTVWEYLTSAAAWKVGAWREAVAKPIPEGAAEVDVTAADFAGQRVHVMLAREAGNGGYGPKNTIKEVANPKVSEIGDAKMRVQDVLSGAAKSDVPNDDDIPF